MSLRIVVVDDNEDLVDSMISVLEHLGHDAVGANDGAEGVQLIEKRQPDIALVDVAMPGMSGFEVATFVRQKPWGRTLVLIALTGWGRDEDRELCHNAGFDEVALKPVDLDQLQNLLARVGAQPAVTQAARTDESFRAARP